MDLREWLTKTVGSLAVAKLAEDIPGGTHGRKKPDLIEWILSDPDATAYATKAMEIDERLTGMPAGKVGFVNRRGDAL